MDVPAIRGVLFDKDGTLFDFSASWRGAADRVLASLAPGDSALQARLGAAVGYDVGSGAFAPGSPIVAGATAEVAGTLAAMLPDIVRGRGWRASPMRRPRPRFSRRPRQICRVLLDDPAGSRWPRARRRDA